MIDTIPDPHPIAMQNADVTFYAQAFSSVECEQYLSQLTESLEWHQPQITAATGTFILPRLVAWYGDPGLMYSYSGVTLHASPWTTPLLATKARVEAVIGSAFNSVLLNLYRDHNDSVGWHSDDEPELGVHPIIASVSFGSTRQFLFRHKHDLYDKHTLELTSGSLLLMRGTTQEFWKHQVPRSKAACGPRLNLTFRTIVSAQGQVD